jgi:hypothetical protein
LLIVISNLMYVILMRLASELRSSNIYFWISTKSRKPIRVHVTTLGRTGWLRRTLTFHSLSDRGEKTGCYLSSTDVEIVWKLTFHRIFSLHPSPLKNGGVSVRPYAITAPHSDC